MSQIRLYLDEDAMQRSFADALLTRGIDFLTARDARMTNQLDSEHLRFAAGQGRALFSFNIRDFFRLHGEWAAEGREHAGTILVQQKRYSVSGRIQRLARLMGKISAEQMRNRVEFLSNRD